MNIEQLDRNCDLFEQRLKRAEVLSAEQFLRELGDPIDDELAVELRKVEQDYRHRHAPTAAPPPPPAGADVDRATELMPVGATASVIGNYKLLQKIGEGGMGVVYMAEQSRPIARRVALKIVKPGMDSQEILARFEAERQALALMDHPSIARVLDAGTTDQGRPYFVMELVKGVPVTTYCDERQLSLRERLKLFLPICHAVQHAHQKGIIHRDLKPSNVLVAQYDNRPVPKIIDFGLAKAIGQKLTERTMFTQFGQIVGTIDYMSPEQAAFNQLDVDTRSDIYALGVLLYELLAGETPFDKNRLHTAAFDELLRIIRQEEPPRPSVRLSSHASLPKIAANRKSEPSKLSLLVRGELDWIVMKAIDKERDRRYQSANAFADDIGRFLQQETVLACPPSPGYRFQKFARRNRTLLASAATVFVSLFLGLAGTSWALVQAKQSEERATNTSRRLQTEIKRLTNAFEVERFQRNQFRRFEEATCLFLDRLAAQYGGEDRIKRSDQQSLTRDAIGFWDQMIAAERDRTGKPGSRTGYYRLQRALCFARAGDHKKAFQEAQALRNDPTRWDVWSKDLFRVCALCAIAAQNDQGLAEFYVDSAIEHLKGAAASADGLPPSPDDPDLAAVCPHQDFRATLDEWRVNHRSKNSGQATSDGAADK